MTIHAAVTEFFYSKDFTTDSERVYRRCLRMFEEWAKELDVTAIEGITTALLRRYTAYLRALPNRKAPGRTITGVSAHGYANTLRTFLNFCAREEWLAERIPTRMEMPKKEKRVLQVFTTKQVQLLFVACEGAETPALVRAVLSLLLDAGLRVAELCKLHLEDVHFESQAAWLKIHGKGRKEREVALGKKARLALHRYLLTIRDAPKDEQHALLGKRGALTQAGVDKMLYALRNRAGPEYFQGVRVSAHTCRHTFAVRFLLAGGDVYKLSRLLGHGSVSTTEIYLQALSARQARENTLSVLDAL